MVSKVEDTGENGERGEKFKEILESEREVYFITLSLYLAGQTRLMKCTLTSSRSPGVTATPFNTNIATSVQHAISRESV